MANEISIDEDLRGFVARLIARTGGAPSGSDVATANGPQAGVTATFNRQLNLTALAFGRKLEAIYSELDEMHDKLVANLKAAVEADQGVADEVNAFLAVIDGTPAAIESKMAPSTVPPATPQTGDSAAGAAARGMG